MEQIAIFQELRDEGLEVLKELFKEEIKPWIDYRAEIEKKIAKKEIDELYEMEKEVV